MKKNKMFFLKNKLNLLILKEKRIAIAYSGGFDSNLALEIYYSFFKKRIFLIHICHNKNRDSLNFVKFCKKNIKNKYNRIKLLIGYVNLDNNSIKTTGVENEERNKRYEKISEISKKHKISYVIFAHNLNDQIETFFLRVLRGSSFIGLECMKNITIFKNIKIVRPFINFKREDIYSIFSSSLSSYFLSSISNKFIIDFTNYNSIIYRNNVRKITLFIFKFFPDFINKFDRFFKDIKLINEIRKKETKRDYLKTKLKLNKICLLSKTRRLNLIEYFLRKKNIKIHSKKWLLELNKQILKIKVFEKNICCLKKFYKIFSNNHNK